jgi:hypothetical protein
MASVFDRPVTRNGIRTSIDPHSDAADEITNINGLFAITSPKQNGPTDRRDSRPAVKTGDALSVSYLDIGSCLFPPVSGFCGSLSPSLHIREIVSHLRFDIVDRNVIERSLVPPETRDVVGLAIQGLFLNRQGGGNAPALRKPPTL